jgi:hypothetical protein
VILHNSSICGGSSHGLQMIVCSSPPKQLLLFSRSS